jgi:hypothetical protein
LYKLLNFLSELGLSDHILTKKLAIRHPIKRKECFCISHRFA